jgi:hypothetical protein
MHINGKLSNFEEVVHNNLEHNYIRTSLILCSDSSSIRC